MLVYVVEMSCKALYDIKYTFITRKMASILSASEPITIYWTANYVKQLTVTNEVTNHYTRPF